MAENNHHDNGLAFYWSNYFCLNFRVRSMAILITHHKEFCLEGIMLSRGERGKMLKYLKRKKIFLYILRHFSFCQLILFLGIGTEWAPGSLGLHGESDSQSIGAWTNSYQNIRAFLLVISRAFFYKKFGHKSYSCWGILNFY